VKPIIIKLTCLVCLLLLAVIKDFLSYKISNYLVLSGFILGFIIHVCENGWTRIPMFFFYIILPILLLFPLFLIKALGAGDIKLFSVIGCFYGSGFCLKSIAVAFAVAAIISVIRLIKYKQVRYRFQYFLDYIKSTYLMFRLGKLNTLPVYYDVKREGYQGVIHFSIAILASVIILAAFRL
jgi:prepilin peptidase CpaA